MKGLVLTVPDVGGDPRCDAIDPAGQRLQRPTAGGNRLQPGRVEVMLVQDRENHGLAQLILVQNMAEPDKLIGRVLDGFSEYLALAVEHSHFRGPAAGIDDQNPHLHQCIPVGAEVK